MRTPLALATAATTLTLLAGCGSSSKSTSTAQSTAGAQSTAATQSAAASTSTAPAAPASATATVITVKHGKLGPIMAAGSKQRTVYLFEADTGHTATCAGSCSKVWPPVTTAGAPSAGAGAVASQLGTITRSDGTTQVTYHGHPLYFFARDEDAGDAYGQGVNSFGAGWYVLKPSGEKLDQS